MEVCKLMPHVSWAWGRGLRPVAVPDAALHQQLDRILDVDSRVEYYVQHIEPHPAWVRQLNPVDAKNMASQWKAWFLESWNKGVAVGARMEKNYGSHLCGMTAAKGIADLVNIQGLVRGAFTWCGLS